MKKITLTLTALAVVFMSAYAQNFEIEKAQSYLKSKSELTFSFQIECHSQVAEFAKYLSVLNYNPQTKTVIAWADASQFKKFEILKIPYNVSSFQNEVTCADIYNVRNFDEGENSSLSFPLSVYPTYAEYANQMQLFEDTYPNLVDKFSIGKTTEGDKDILFVKISDNVETEEQEPKLMLTSSIHGDEIAGFPMMLTLIDYILKAYNNQSHEDHEKVKYLLENTEIWINPNANPDGTYYNSPDNTSVVNARRGNANNVDLNRNFPDNVAGPNPDGNEYQVETIAFMELAASNQFVISANFHGGSELVNYPFDNAHASEYEHPDGNWFELIGKEYANKARTDANNGEESFPSYKNKLTYMTADEDAEIFPSPGVTHGAEWYKVFGGRQDYMNYYHQCKEITIELSDEKILPESRLVDYWYYNKNALLNFLLQGTYGFRGTVTDAYSNEAIKAKVTLMGHDEYGSHTYSEKEFGAFYRPIKGGTYDILIEAKRYQPIVMINQSIADYQSKNLGEIELVPAVESLSAASEAIMESPTTFSEILKIDAIDVDTNTVLYKR